VVELAFKLLHQAGGALLFNLAKGEVRPLLDEQGHGYHARGNAQGYEKQQFGFY
jgi:hypothetical protein